MKGNVSWNHPQKIEYGANDVTWKVTALSSPKEYETYVSRLRWICYATVMEQCQAVILHTTILDRLISAYRIGLPQYIKAGGKAPSKLDIDKELLNGVYDKRGITTNKMDAIFSKVHKAAEKLEQDAITLSQELFREMGKYNPAKWAREDYKEPEFTTVKWNDLLEVVAIEEVLFAYIPGYMELNRNNRANLEKYKGIIYTYLRPFTADSKMSLKNIREKRYDKIKKEIQGFIKPSFIKALEAITQNSSIGKQIFDGQMDKTISIKNISALIAVYGQSTDEQKISWMGLHALPVFLVHASQEAFEEVFPRLQVYKEDDLTPFINSRYYSKLLMPHRELWERRLLEYAYTSYIGNKEPRNHVVMGEMIFGALLGNELGKSKRMKAKIRKAKKEQEPLEQENEDEAERVREYLLPELYEEYPELKEYLYELVDGDVELTQMLNL